MKKNLLPVCALLLGALQANAAVDEQFKIDDVQYIIKSENTVGVYSVANGVTACHVQETVDYNGKTYTVVAIEDEAFHYSNIVELQLPSTITYIGRQAFASSKLKSINLPKGLKTISDYAFYACRQLKKIEIPEGITKLGNVYGGNTFGACSSLQEVILPQSLDTIGNGTFYHNSSLKSIKLPSKVKYLGKNSFNSCDSLQQVNLPADLLEIAAGAFGNCQMLNKVDNASKHLVSIGNEAFMDCPITEFSIPSSCSTLGDRAFSGSKIKEFKLDPENKYFKMVGKSIYTADMNLLMMYPPCAPEKEAVVAEGCLGINAGAFYRAQLDKVTLPSSVVAIGDFAFCYSTVSDIKMTDNVVYIGEQAFAASHIRSMVLPSELGQLSSATFAGCDSLVSVTIPASVKLMGNRQFWKCKNIKEIHFLGYHAPEFDYWEYALEAPFYGVTDKSVTVTCPKGRTANYQNEFNNYDAIKAVNDTEAGVIIPSLVTPTDNSSVSILDKLTFNFSEEVTAVTSKPEIRVICGDMTAYVPVGKEIPVGMWALNKNSNQEFYAVPLDEYGEGGEPVNMEKGKTYFVTLPAGVFKNAEGFLNEAVTVKYNGEWEKPVLRFSNAVPEVGTELEQLENVYISFDAPTKKAYNAADKVKLIEGTLVDGIPTGEEFMGYANQWFVNVKDSTAQIFPADYDAYLTPIKLNPGKEYFLVIGEKAFYSGNDATAYNEEIVLNYQGNVSTGVQEVLQAPFFLVKNANALEVHVTGKAAAAVVVYNAAGQMVASQNGVTGVANFSGLTKGVYVVKVVTANGTKSVKVMM